MTTNTDVHTCSYYCERPGCIRAQRDELVARLTAAQQQPAEGEEIMVNTPYDVFTLPLQPSGLSSGPRFVVHVPGPEQPAAVDGAARRRDVRLWMRHNAGSYSTATELAEAAAEVFNLPDGGLDNETHWVWDEAVEAINDAQREELS